ncbi:MAG: hypothetical protein Q8880_00610 [Bacteroidota bacterium]|nr:hypothetical protein [Bacteroidota bacterium]
MNLIFITRKRIKYNDKLQRLIDNSTEYHLITQNNLLKNYKIDPNKIKYYKTDKSKVEDSIYSFIQKTVNTINHNFKTKEKHLSPGVSIMLKLQEHFQLLFYAIYIITDILKKYEKQNDFIAIVDDKTLYKKLKYSGNINVFFADPEKIEKKTLFSRIHYTLRFFWLEWMIIHIKNLFSIPVNIKHYKQYENFVVYDTYNQSMIKRLNLYISNKNEDYLYLVADKRIKKLVNSSKCIYFTQLLNPFSLFRNFYKNYFTNLIIFKKIDLGQYYGFDINKDIPRKRLLRSLSMAAAEQDCYIKFFKKNFKNAKLILSNSAVHSRTSLFINLSRELSLNYRILQHGYPLQKTGYLPVDNLLVYDENSYKIFKEWGVKNIYKIELFKNEKIKPKNILKSQVLVCLSDVHEDNIKILEYLKYYHKKSDNSLIFRIRKHPGTFFLPHELSDFIDSEKETYFYDTFSSSRESILNSSLVISYYSTIIQEATELGKKVLVLQDLDYWSHCNFDNINYIENYPSFTKYLINFQESVSSI